MEYITTKQAAELWGITIRRVQALCQNGQIDGAKCLVKFGLSPKVLPNP
jgi:hypothetical protein